MRTLHSVLSLIFLFSANALAVDICAFPETSTFTESMKINNIRPVRTARNHKKLTSVEKQLIHKMINLETYRQTSSLKESLEAFGDFYQGVIGPNAGEVSYFNFAGKQVILVHYWPGDTEVGAFFSINKNGSFKLVAVISDGEISCL